MTDNIQKCPCCSGQTYDSCCKPFLSDQRKASTAKQLMRSRYTAFVNQDSSYILKTWHPKTRPKSLNFEDNPVVWLGLETKSCVEGGESDSAGSVEFITNYLESGQLCTLTEKSAFTKEDNLWLYVKGECEFQKKKVERNRPCPCGSGKKFKRCCINI